MLELPTLRKRYQSSRSFRVLSISFLSLLFTCTGFIATIPFANVLLSFIQWLLNYYPEDADPEFVLTLILSSVMWAASLVTLFLRSAGADIRQWILHCSASFILFVSLLWILHVISLLVWLTQ